MIKITRSQLLRAFSRLPRTRPTEKLPGAVRLLSTVMPVHESAIQSLRAITPLYVRQLLKALPSPIDLQKIVSDPALSNLLEIKEINFDKNMLPVLLAKGHNVRDISAQKVFPVIYKGFKVEAPLSIQPMLPIISVSVSAEKVNVAYTGNSGSSGIGVGRARRLEPWEKEYPIVKYTVANTAKEIERFRKAVNAAKKTVREESSELAAKPETKDLALSCQSMWAATLGSEVPDPQNPGQKTSKLEAEVIGKILEEQSNADVFLMEYISERAKKYENIEDAYIRDRWRDIIGNGRLILEKLMRIPTKKPLEKQEANVVLVVPGELYQTDFRKLRDGFMHLKAIVTETGSVTSHVSLLARALGVPAVVGLGDAINKIQEGDFVVVDGGTGKVITRPNS
ncbi:MAG: PEP-utilizing enzyme, partial [Candidatus Saganbacteria bacterium]|nr:PEP-utilizing enzyme [Candidatus Saganbacteria bacterium]